MTKNDQYYINKVIEGDANAFAYLVDKYKNLVFTLVYRLLKNKEEAEEVSQDAFIKAFNSLSRFKGDSKFSTWIYRIAYNSSLDNLKKNKKYQNDIPINNITENQIGSVEDALSRIEKQEREYVIKQCLSSLPSDESFLVSLYYYEDLSIKEISEVLGLTTSNTKIKLYRSRKRLATILRQKLEPEIIEQYEG